MTDYTRKNANRKQGHSNGNRAQQKFAREMRRAHDGKFGHLKPGQFNDMLPGTTGTLRKLRADEVD